MRVFKIFWVKIPSKSRERKGEKLVKLYKKKKVKRGVPFSFLNPNNSFVVNLINVEGFLF